MRVRRIKGRVAGVKPYRGLPAVDMVVHKVLGIACCSTYISNKGDVVMDCRIEAQEAFEMFGVSTDINRVDGQAYFEIHESWASALKTER